VSRIIEINEASDQRLRDYANLRADVHRSADSESFIVEGRWCVQRLIESPQAIISVLLEHGKHAEIADRLPAQTPVYSLPSTQIERLVGFDFHRGILACGRRPKRRTIDDLQREPESPPVSLAVLGIDLHENLGSMIRTASALGIESLLIGPKTADPFARRTIRVSMGCVLTQRLYDLDRPVAQLSELQRSRNLRTIVTTLDDRATPLNQFVGDDRNSILIVGNEAKGIDGAIQDIATDRVTIPMQPGFDSLNVSVAAAICMYQLLDRD
jgi:tRNA G18 (ribose-2'-O)-methylase SpoU